MDMKLITWAHIRAEEEEARLLAEEARLLVSFTLNSRKLATIWHYGILIGKYVAILCLQFYTIVNKAIDYSTIDLRYLLSFYN